MHALFEPEIKIPHSDMRLFTACNNADRNWHLKQVFYAIKNEILEKHADVSGYDMQVVDYKCNSCGGTGIHSHNRRCYSCTDGIYQTRTFILKRYILNGKLFHRPVDYINSPIIDTIKGLIDHPAPEINPDFAFACIIKKYKPDMWPDYLRSFRRTFSRTDKKKWGEISAKTANIIDALAIWFDVKESDDLPF